MRWLTLCIAAFLTVISISSAVAAENCRVCHRVVVTGGHAGLACLDCHVSESATIADPSVPMGGGTPCLRCHKEFGGIFSGPMTTRSNEIAFVARSYGRGDGRFFEKNCTGCHLKSCLDCHEGGGHDLRKPATERCLSCHRGYYVGWDYAGRAPREESLRYQRGRSASGEHYLTMRPDIHFEKGLACGDCHSMKSLAAGRKSSRNCTDCHKIGSGPVEHRIKAHLEKMECFTCHSAWAPQEYGTFFLRFTESPSREDFWLKGSEVPGEYLRSAYLKRQDEPPLGMNSRGKVSPIRPQFIAYYTHIRREQVAGRENRLLAAEWLAFFPHTIRRGTLLCDGCHDAPSRFLVEARKERIFRPADDGMGLESFWDRRGQRVANGSFLSEDRVKKLQTRGPEFQKGYLEKWQLFSNRVEGSF
ncbi:hypothetical protein OR1_01597 [Geobacter sp. OR-1]|uniref:selenite/tellurite reduction operon b-type cytochrome iron-sulfur cluster-binding subunit ExtO n=1 Tax=Geobacter sp. OR-1 TaxID=1266765 RepID=UPI000543D52F|nr:selenite/tellurite reduction operon b-type cytochrome iron-sulfur cluster-binding subunit ExtO [Geobacter sp. OR-1]GAM09322.1 hypothetical protein OR1_01597 [Geobacter sp. OR-1]